MKNARVKEYLRPAPNSAEVKQRVQATLKLDVTAKQKVTSVARLKV